MKNYDLDEIKRKIAIVFLVVVIYLLILNTLLNPAMTDVVYIKKGNIYRGFFTEPFETLLLIFKDGKFMTFTTQHDYQIEMPFNWLKEYLEIEGMKISDIIVAIHNHSTPISFTNGNKYYYRKFRENGFNGHFCIYYTFNDVVETLEDKSGD